MPASITSHPPGDTAGDLQIGDFLLTGKSSRRFLSRAIKFGARVRGYGKEAQNYSHAALVISRQGDIAEALARGVEKHHIHKYRVDDYKVVRAHVEPHDQAQVLYYANDVLDKRAKYGMPTLMGLALYCATGAHLCIQRAGTAICSGFVADALTRAGYDFPRPPFAMMPADLEAFFAGSADEDQRREQRTLEAAMAPPESPPSAGEPAVPTPH
jgi:hypothetical protein